MAWRLTIKGRIDLVRNYCSTGDKCIRQVTRKPIDSPPRWSSYSQSLFRIVMQNNATFLQFLCNCSRQEKFLSLLRGGWALHDFAILVVSKNTCTSSLKLFGFHTASSQGGSLDKQRYEKSLLRERPPLKRREVATLAPSKRCPSIEANGARGWTNIAHSELKRCPLFRVVPRASGPLMRLYLRLFQYPTATSEVHLVERIDSAEGRAYYGCTQGHYGWKASLPAQPARTLLVTHSGHLCLQKSKSLRRIHWERREFRPVSLFWWYIKHLWSIRCTIDRELQSSNTIIKTKIWGLGESKALYRSTNQFSENVFWSEAV